MPLITSILRPALDFVLPERCPSCGTITGAGGDFCANCWQRVRFLGGPCCTACAMPFEYDQGDEACCASCLAHPPAHDGIRAVAAYDDVTKQIALRLKYGGRIGLAKLIARQLARHLPDDRSDILIAPVPLHWSRIWARSFNQSALIADGLADLGALEHIPDLLVRSQRTPSLRGLSAKERRRTVGRAFRINPRWQDRVQGARIILVDDVLTTGATSDACIKVLKRGGAQWVQLFCWARVIQSDTTQEDWPLALDA